MTPEIRPAMQEAIAARETRSTTQESQPRRLGSSRRANLALLLGSLLVSAALLEVGGRFLLPAPLPWLQPQLRFRADPALVFTLVPGQEAYTADKLTRINSQGMRGPLVAIGRDEQTLRLLFLGDSIVFGYGVSDEDVVSERVAAGLEAHSIRTEVINAGVPAYNTDQEIAYLERDGVPYNPDWVILGFCWNDIGDKVGVAVNETGDLLSSGDPRTPGWSESPVAYAVRNALKRSRFLYGATEGLRALSRLNSPPDATTAMRTAVLEDEDTPEVTAGWFRVLAALHHFKELSDRVGFHPLVVAFPIPLQLQRNFPKSTYPVKLREIARQEGLQFVDLEPVFRREYRGHESLFIPYDGDHPNAVGHDIAAREIVRVILESGAGT